MKKFLGIFLVFTLLVTLIACDTRIKQDVIVEDINKTLVNRGTSIEFNLTIEDPKDEITGKIFVSIREEGGKEDLNKEEFNLKDLVANDKKDDEDEEEDDENKNLVVFKSLKEGNKYIVYVKTTIKNKTVTLYTSKVIKTEAPKELKISSEEDFLRINNNLNAIYELTKDLDFADYDQEEIDKNVIKNFSGEFDGKGFTIKNYTTTSRNTSIGLFGQLSKSAVVENLKLENVHINVQPESYITGSRYAGVLFGQAQSTQVRVRNIEISNSKISVPKLNSEGRYIKIGLLGGVSTGTIEDVKILGDNVIDVIQQRVGEVRIGGLLGEATNEASKIKNAVVEGKINYQIDQDKSRGLRGKPAEVFIGGLVGDSLQISYENVLSKVDIEVSKLNFKLVSQTYREDKDKNDIRIELMVGGLFGKFANSEVENAIYSGNIDVKEFEFENLLVEKVEDEEGEDVEQTLEIDYDYIIRIKVGSIAGELISALKPLKNVLRVDSNVTVADGFFVDEKEISRVIQGVLFGYSTNRDSEFYVADALFGYVGDVEESLLVDGMKEYAKVTDLISEDSDLLNYLNK